MKKWLIASSICILPIFFLGVCNPIIALMLRNKQYGLSGIRKELVLAYAGILLISILIVVTTTLGMIRYADRIDKLDEKDKKLDEEWSRIQTIRRNYEKLIADEKGTIQQTKESEDSGVPKAP